MNEKSPTLINKGLTSATQIKRLLKCDTVNMPQNQETGTGGCLPITPDPLRLERSQLLSFRNSNSVQDCLCDFKSDFHFQKTKRPNAKQLLIQPEFPATLGFHKNGKDKTSNSARSTSVTMLKRPQLTCTSLPR
ncbi:hypothetical protein AHF37_08726 [Paragonimus kellicotti]|nr:hypothetical protein AHF37_08726 [Paragonimus kellicotti]